MCQTFGYGEAELLTKRLGDLIAPEDTETVQRLLAQLLAGDVMGYHMETRALRADGAKMWIQLSASLMHDDPEKASRDWRIPGAL